MRDPQFESMVTSDLGLYLAAVLIWGSTWLAITFQLGKVPAEVSVVYRFALASALLLGWCLVRRLRLAFPWRDHLWMALQGSLLVRHGHPAVAEAFLATRLGGDWGGAYGTMPTGLDVAPILERAVVKG